MNPTYETTKHGRRLSKGWGVVHRHRFNANKSSIVWAWSYINRAWFVWREDGDHQALIRIHNDWDDAKEDFFSRVKFLDQLEGAA